MSAGMAYEAMNNAQAAGNRLVVILTLEQRIFEQIALELLIQLKGRQLQQLDRLLQLRRQREVLREP